MFAGTRHCLAPVSVCLCVCVLCKVKWVCRNWQHTQRSIAARRSCCHFILPIKFRAICCFQWRKLTAFARCMPLCHHRVLIAALKVAIFPIHFSVCDSFFLGAALKCVWSLQSSVCAWKWRPRLELDLCTWVMASPPQLPLPSSSGIICYCCCCVVWKFKTYLKWSKVGFKFPLFI